MEDARETLAKLAGILNKPTGCPCATEHHAKWALSKSGRTVMVWCVMCGKVQHRSIRDTSVPGLPFRERRTRLTRGVEGVQLGLFGGGE